MKPIKLQATDFAAIAVILMYSSSATITPICFISMSKEFGLSLSAGGGIESIRSMLIFFCLFFSGVAAAKFGKVRSLAAGAAILSAGFAFCAASPSYLHILGSTVLIGFGAGILEGLINPLVQDAHPDDSGRYMNITNAFWSVGVFATVLVAGELLTKGVSWRAIMAVLSVCSAAAAAFMFAMRKNQPAYEALSVKEIILQYGSCLKSRRFWVFSLMMVLAGGAEGAFTFWSASYIQINFGTLPRMGGLGTACFAAGMMSMRLLGGMFVKQKHLRRLILTSAIAGSAVAITVPFVQSPYAFFPVLFLAGTAIACFWPSIQPYAVDRMRLDSTAVFILLSCAGIPGFGLTSLAMGIIGDFAGLAASFFIVPVMLALLALIVLVERAYPPRKETP